MKKEPSPSMNPNNQYLVWLFMNLTVYQNEHDWCSFKLEYISLKHFSCNIFFFILYINKASFKSNNPGIWLY